MRKLYEERGILFAVLRIATYCLVMAPIPGAIGWEVFLSYIGLGLSVDTPSLGNLVNTGRALMSAPSLRYQLIFPAAILSVITICFYIVGNAFADAADPRNHV